MELELIKELGMVYRPLSSKYKRRFGLYKCGCGEESKELSLGVL